MNRQMQALLQIHTLRCSRPVLTLLLPSTPARKSVMLRHYPGILSPRPNLFATAFSRRCGIQLRLPRITNLEEEIIRWLSSAQNVALHWEKG